MSGGGVCNKYNYIYLTNRECYRTLRYYIYVYIFHVSVAKITQNYALFAGIVMEVVMTVECHQFML